MTLLDETPTSLPNASAQTEEPSALSQPTAVVPDVDPSSIADFQKAVRRINSRTTGVTERANTVRLLTAWLEGLEPSEIASLMGVNTDTLDEWLRGERSVPGRLEKRLNALTGIVTNLHGVIERSAVGRWFHLSIPALGEHTALEAISEGRIKEVLSVTESYFDPAYG